MCPYTRFMYAAVASSVGFRGVLFPIVFSARILPRTSFSPPSMPWRLIRARLHGSTKNRLELGKPTNRPGLSGGKTRVLFLPILRRTASPASVVVPKFGHVGRVWPIATSGKSSMWRGSSGRPYSTSRFFPAYDVRFTDCTDQIFLRELERAVLTTDPPWTTVRPLSGEQPRSAP